MNKQEALNSLSTEVETKGPIFTILCLIKP